MNESVLSIRKNARRSNTLSSCVWMRTRRNVPSLWVHVLMVEMEEGA
jgi:hypothetical protein